MPPGSHGRPPPPNRMFAHSPGESPRSIEHHDAAYDTMNKHLLFYPGLIPPDEGPTIGSAPVKDSVAGYISLADDTIHLRPWVRHLGSTLLHELYHRAHLVSKSLPDQTWPDRYAQAMYNEYDVPQKDQGSYTWVPHEVAARDIQEYADIALRGLEDPYLRTLPGTRLRDLFDEHIRGLRHIE